MAIYRAGEVLPYEIWYLERLDLTKLDIRAAKLLDGNIRYGADSKRELKNDVKREIMANMAENGQIEPVCVWGHEPGQLRIMVGHCRAHCATALGDPFVKALVSITAGLHGTLNELVEPESFMELVEPLTPEMLRSYFQRDPRSLNLNRRGWGVTPADTKEYR